MELTKARRPSKRKTTRVHKLKIAAIPLADAVLDYKPPLRKPQDFVRDAYNWHKERGKLPSGRGVLAELTRVTHKHLQAAAREGCIEVLSHKHIEKLLRKFGFH
jgi:hypothetical protein